MEKMEFGEFVRKYGTACGGNWTAMLMSAIRRGMPTVWDQLDPHHNYTFAELAKVIEDNL